jgi:hypothetical protein
VTGPAGEQPSDLYTGALLRLTAATEHLGQLDAREAAHYQEITARLGQIAETLAALKVRGDGLASALADQAAILASLEGIDQRIAALTRQYAAASDGNRRGEDHAPRPGPPRPWWRMMNDPALEQQVRALLAGETSSAVGSARIASDLAKDIRRLRHWANRIYVPGYGHLAATLGPCWDQHPLCLYTLDWLSELWQVLYLTGQRSTSTLAAQAEFQIRLLPAAAAQMHAETSGCTMHSAGGSRARPVGKGSPSTSP